MMISVEIIYEAKSQDTTRHVAREYNRRWDCTEHRLEKGEFRKGH